MRSRHSAKRRSLQLLMAASALCAATASPSLAQVTAAQLQEEIRTGIAELRQTPGYAEVLQFDGVVDVTEEADGVLRVTLPSLRLGPPNNLAGLVLGQITFLVTENTERYYDIEMRVADEFTLQTEAGQVYATMALDPNRASASRWDRELGLLVYTDTTADRFTFTSNVDRFSITIDEIAIGLNFTLKGDELYDGIASASAANISYSSRRSRVGWSIGAMELISTVTDINLPTYMAAMPAFDALSEALRIEFPNTNDPAELRVLQVQEAQERREAVAGLFDALTAPNVLGDNSDLELSLEDIRIALPPMGTTANIDSMDLRLAYEGLAGSRSAYRLAFTHEGLALDAPFVSGIYQLIVPRDLTLNIGLTDVPSRGLWRYLQELSTQAQIPRGRALQDQVLALQEQLAAGPATIEITKLLFEAGSPGPRVELEGAFTFVEGMMLSPLRGGAIMTTTGMDEIARGLEAAGGGMMTQLAYGLSVVNLFGNQADEPDENGRTIRSYTLRLSETGDLTINDRDLSQLQQLLFR